MKKRFKMHEVFLRNVNLHRLRNKFNFQVGEDEEKVLSPTAFEKFINSFGLGFI